MLKLTKHTSVLSFFSNEFSYGNFRARSEVD